MKHIYYFIELVIPANSWKVTSRKKVKEEKFNFIASSLCSRASGFGFRSCYTLFSNSLKCLYPWVLLQVPTNQSIFMYFIIMVPLLCSLFTISTILPFDSPLCLSRYRAQRFSRTNIFSVFPFLFAPLGTWVSTLKGRFEILILLFYLYGSFQRI